MFTWGYDLGFDPWPYLFNLRVSPVPTPQPLRVAGHLQTAEQSLGLLDAANRSTEASLAEVR